MNGKMWKLLFLFVALVAIFGSPTSARACFDRTNQGQNGNRLTNLCRQRPQRPLSNNQQQRNTTGCRYDWYNLCHSNSECCSGVCYLGGGGWKDGVCHPRNYRAGTTRTTY